MSNINSENNIGNINIADDVITIITNIAASEIEGVKGLKHSIGEDLSGIFNKKGYNKGIKVEVEDKQVFINLNIVVNYGIKIPEISWKVQENVKQAIESMTDLKVAEVNVYVISINF